MICVRQFLPGALVFLTAYACQQQPIISFSDGEISSQPTVKPQLPVSQHPNSFMWRNVNIQGMGSVTGLVINPQPPHDIYIRTDIGGAYRFDRQHHHWIPLMDMFDTNFAGGGIGVESLAVDGNFPQRVYAVVNYRYQTQREGDKLKYGYSGEVLVSNDRGRNWQPTGLAPHQVFVGPNQDYRGDTGERLAVDPNLSSLLYFASRRHGLWRRNPQGSWQRVGGGLPSPQSLPGYKTQGGKDNLDLPGFTFVAFDRRTGNRGQPTPILYVGVHGSGVWQSRDGGKSWRNLGGGDNPVRGVVAQDGSLYVSFATRGRDGEKARGGVKRYRNQSWQDITPERENKPYGGITVANDSSDTVMVVSDRMVYRSRNGGKSWDKQTMDMAARVGEPSTPGYYDQDASAGLAAIMIDPANRKQVWWTNGWGVARTTDITANPTKYTWVMTNLEELDVNMVRVPPKPKNQGGAELVSAVQDRIGFRHINSDSVPQQQISPENIAINPAFKWANPDWQVYPVPFPHVAGATSMDYAASKPDYLAFVGFHQWQGYWSIHGMSRDNGKTWQSFPSVPTQMLWKQDKSKQEEVKAIAGQIAMSPTNPQNLVWAATWGTWPHYTRDGGKTWQLARNLNPHPRPEPFDERNNDHIYYDALPKSWSNSISPWLSSHILAADRQDPKGQTFYYYAQNAFYFSRDGGANWSKGANGQFPMWVTRPTIVPNPTRQGDVWLSFARNPEDVKGYPLYRSQDGGKSFTKVPNIHSCEFISFGKGKSANIPYIYIFGRVKGATRDTMYKSEDMGKTWKPISNPQILQFPGITHMEADLRIPNRLYVALRGRGIMVGSQGI